MPKCFSCNKTFKDRQALGNHIKKHLDDSDDDLPFPNQTISQISPKKTTKVNDKSISRRQNVIEETKINDISEKDNLNIDEFNKRLNLDISLVNHTNSSQSHDESIEEQNAKFFNTSDFYSSNTFDNKFRVSDSSTSHSSNISDNESTVSDLSDITNIDINEYAEYNNLISGKPKGPEDIYQEFLSEEHAEFMNIITHFHVQDLLANAFIRFFNKYSNHNDYLLLLTSQTGQVFIENLNLPNFG
ncbi:19694_t:CDS:1 [Racocetra persica]|uniref:19694_t:CDS:1 n=1 Tax=Racocetra persica TaxID=160502 RepID=A0ACA9QRN9_9GLOM|nr:19694_t:CDS:1 [Racocetra persica]